MKINIGPYLNWWGPYQIAGLILFWKDKDDDSVFKFGEFLATTPLSPACDWIYSKRKRTKKIQIDKYDVWSMDSTLALIILPMLKQLREQKHGAPSVDNEDVPWWLSSKFFVLENDWDTDTNHFKRWDWVLDEIIWTFDQLGDTNEWEDRYHHGVIDLAWENDETTPTMSIMVSGPKDTHWFDADGYTRHTKHIANGLRLFGKYYQNLWD